MSQESIEIKDAITIASPFIKGVVDTFVTPKLEKFRDRNKNKKNLEFLPTSNHFTEYFHRTFRKLIVVNTLVFNNSQKLLSDIYIPLTLRNSQDSNIKVKITDFPQEISDEYGNILITDTAGMGKSTLMKAIFIDSIYKTAGIPIFIELRRLSRNKTILEEIIEQLNSIDKAFDKKLLLELISEGEFIFFLDGYDEIILKDREIVTKDIQEFISKANKNRFFITSRPEKALLSFGNFQEFKIQPLVKKEAFELLRKYDKQGAISSLLIKKLQERELENISEFLTNPLLVSLLFTAFEHKQSIPFKKYLFYRQVYDANFENHDLTKGDSYIHDKYCGLEIDDFHRALRHIGFSCLKLQQIEFSKDEILKLISESKKFCVDLDFRESDFLLDLLKTVPLFSQDGNYYRWSHKSLQEYFAAQFIYLDSKEKQDEIINTLYQHSNLEKFINVLDLYYDMDYKTFRTVVEFNILEEYFKFQESNYCKLKEELPFEIIKERLEISFLNDAYIFKGDIDMEKDKKSSVSFSKKMNRMLKDFLHTNGLDNDKFNGVIHHYGTSGIYALHYIHPKKQLLNLLNNKNNPIAYSKNRNANIIKIDLSCKIEKDYNLCHVNENLSDCFNSAENFEKLNQLLINTNVFSIRINHNEALKRYMVVKEEIESNSKASLLDGFN